jgi:hypothetical protein
VLCKLFHLYDVELDLWSVGSAGLPFVVMLGDHGEVRFCGLTSFGMVETVGIHQVMWFVMLESANYRPIGVDTPGQ